MAQTHDINPELQRLTGEYHGGALNTAEYRDQRRLILEEIAKLKAPPPKSPTSPQTRKVRKAKYLGLALLVISVVALLLFGFKMH